MKEDKVAWLKRMENGSIGETRTKAILIDRFWILERSVDVNGADLLIQRQLKERDLNDPKPAKFGVVQAKFRQKLPTTIEIKEEYVLLNGRPRDNFFLFVHTGMENERRAYFYTADQLVKLLDENFRFTIQDPLPSNVYESTKEVLNEIEKKLERMDLNDNYSSIFSRNSSQLYYHQSLDLRDFAPVKEEFKVTLPRLGDFGWITDEARQEVKKFIIGYVDPLIEIANKMKASADPIEIYDLWDEFASESPSRGLQHHCDNLSDAIDSYREIEGKLLISGLRNFCSRVRTFVTEDMLARRDSLLLKTSSYKIVLRGKDFLKEVGPIEISSSLVSTPENLLKSIESHIESEQKKNEDQRYVRRPRYFQAFDVNVVSEDSIEIIVNLSQARETANILYYEEQVKKNDGIESSYLNPKVDLDKWKEKFLAALADRILAIAVNRIFDKIRDSEES